MGYCSRPLLAGLAPFCCLAVAVTAAVTAAITAFIAATAAAPRLQQASRSTAPSSILLVIAAAETARLGAEALTALSREGEDPPLRDSQGTCC